MKWVVCKFKEEGGKLFIVSRKAREKILDTFRILGQPVDSIVLKETDDYSAAAKYKQDYEVVNNLINRITKP